MDIDNHWKYLRLFPFWTISVQTVRFVFILCICDICFKNHSLRKVVFFISLHLNENFDWKKLKNCKVWVASYSDTRPKLPVSADLWQYTKKGSLEGANTDKGYCDLVYSYMEATSIKFTKPTLTMKKNTTAQATVKIKPNGCTDRKSFTSSNPKVVAVNKKTGKLTAKKAGKATITVTTGSGRKAKMKVVVK